MLVFTYFFLWTHSLFCFLPTLLWTLNVQTKCGGEKKGHEGVGKKYLSKINWIAVGVLQKDDNDNESDTLCMSEYQRLHKCTTESARGPLYGGEKPSHGLKQLDVADKV